MGKGIGREFLPRVFESLSQEGGTSTRQHGGLGLGLSIVKQLVEMCGGTVRVESEGPGLGSTFTVSLPARGRITTQHARWPGGGNAAEVPAEEAISVRMRVLVVDDESEMRKMIATVRRGGEA
jgi:hypothetical protein